MEINGLVTTQDGNSISIVGFTGKDLACEGCGEKVATLLETDDSVLLCKLCFDSSAEDFAHASLDVLEQKQAQEIIERIEREKSMSSAIPECYEVSFRRIKAQKERIAALEAQVAEVTGNYQTLLDDAVEMRAQVQTLETALKFYADRDNHEMDGGKRARAALAATEPKEKA